MSHAAVAYYRYRLASVNEVRAALGLGPDGDTMGDTWRDDDGCWADVWFERHREYLACNERPDPDSELGLCPRHEAKMQQLKEAS